MKSHCAILFVFLLVMALSAAQLTFSPNWGKRSNGLLFGGDVVKVDCRDLNGFVRRIHEMIQVSERKYVCVLK